jgi:glycosyltransferase involved in cell wall biosynthesis
MKIGVLLNHLSSHGGIEKIASQKINAWIDLYGYEVVLITKNQEGKTFIYSIDEKCKHYDLNISNYTGTIYSYFKNLKNYFQLCSNLNSIIRKEKIDILFSTLTSIDSLLIPFVKQEVPKILEFHHSGFFLSANSWYFKKKIMEQYKAVVVLNPDEVHYYGLKNIKIIPNFIDDFKNNEIRIKKRSIIISAGRIDPIKQFDHLVEIWSIIANKHSDWEVHIYGNGSKAELQKINDAINKYNLTESFKIFPATDNFMNKLNESSIFVQVSASECFPMVLLEAMQAKLPILAYDSPNGPRNIITNLKDGILVALNDKHHFTEKLDSIINNPEFRNSLIQNQEAKIFKFSKTRVMQKWNDLAIHLVKNKF